MYDFYSMLSIDSPGFVDKETRRANKNPPWSSEIIKSIRQESPVNQDISKRRVNPSYNPFSQSSAQPQRQNVITFRSTNPSDLDWEQQESAEKAEARRRAPRKNAPIPSDGDDTNTDGETSYLFENKLTSAQKSRILDLRREIKRIKSRNHTKAYLKDRERAINNAEFDRSAGGLGPEYLTGVNYPWRCDSGHAPIHYDVYQVEMRQSLIDKIKNNNAVACQLEYTANKGGPRGQVRR